VPKGNCAASHFKGTQVSVRSRRSSRTFRASSLGHCAKAARQGAVQSLPGIRVKSKERPLSVMKDLVTLTCLSGCRYETFGLLTLTNWNHNTVQGGDSGSPWFFTLDGELCLADILSSSLGSYKFYPPDVRHEVTDPAYMQASVNAAMRELSLSNGRTNIYSLTVKDLSKYPIYRQSYNCWP